MLIVTYYTNLIIISSLSPSSILAESVRDIDAMRNVLFRNCLNVANLGVNSAISPMEKDSPSQREQL